MMNAELTDGSLGPRYISSVFLSSVLQTHGSWLMKHGNEINKSGGAHCCVPVSEEKSIWKGEEMTAIFKLIAAEG